MPKTIILLLLWLLPSAAYAGKLVAVLEFGGIGIDSSVLIKLSDSTRVAARNVLPKSEYDLMTRENLVQILQDNEIDPSCIEGECEVETGRNIGADLIISGDVMRLDGQYLLTLKLYETESGNLLSATETEASKALELIHNVGPHTKTLIKKGLGIGSAGLREGNFSGSLDDRLDVGSEQKGIVRFKSSPSGATVLVNGVLVCPSTPCSKRVPLGMQTVTVQRERYKPYQQDVLLRSKGDHFAALIKDYATLTINAPTGVIVYIDDEKLGKIPIREAEIDKGQRTIKVIDPCFVGQVYEYTAVPGKEELIREYPVRERTAGVDVNVQKQGDDVSAKIYVDGDLIGESPLETKLPICSKKLEVKYKGQKATRKLSLREGELERIEIKLKKKEKVKISSDWWKYLSLDLLDGDDDLYDSEYGYGY